MNYVAAVRPASLRVNCAAATAWCCLTVSMSWEAATHAVRWRSYIADMADVYRGRGNLFVVSTRIVGYEGQLDRYGFAVRTVQDLDDDATRDSVTRRYRAIALGEGIGRSKQEQEDLRSQYEGRANLLLRDLARNQGLRSLTTNPLLLSLIVLVHLVQIKLPEQRHLLYRDCVEILTERWQARKRERSWFGASAAARRSNPGSEKSPCCREIALTIQKRRQDL